MRATAWAYARRKRGELLLLLGIGCGFLAGLGVGRAPHTVFGIWVDAPWAPAAASCAIGVAIGVFWWTSRSIERARLARLNTGDEAGTHAGQVIEYALTTPGCAVAHSVTSIARTGDIDHLVATPLRLWVIETRYPNVRREHFPEVLHRIAENTTAAWSWAPPGTPVRGCLVLATGSEPKRKTYDYGKEPVVVHTPASLARELKAEAGTERMIDERVADDVWKLGRLTE